MIRRLVLVALTIGAFLLAVPGTAHAQIDIIPGDHDCKEAPEPEMPGTGWASWAVPTPDVPPKPEAFNPAHIYEQGGLAGFELTTYDLGCAGKGLGTEILTVGLNLLLFFPLLGFALFGGLASLVFNPGSWIGVLDPVITSVVGALQAALWSPAAPVGMLALAALGAWIMWHGWGEVRIARSLQAAAFALATLFALVIVFNIPTKIAHGFDQAQAYTVGQAVNATSGGQGSASADVAMTGALVEAILWPQWKAEHFPDTNGATARKWAGPLFESRRLTWHEAAIYKSDPKGAGAEIWQAKQQAFERVVGEICDADKAACSWVKGKKVGQRFGSVLLTYVGAGVVLPFPVVALLIALMSMLMVRFALMVFPVAGLFFFPATQHIVLTPLRLVGSALINLLAFVFGFGVLLRVVGAFLNPASGLTGLAATLLAGVAALGAWIVLRRFRSPTFQIRKWRPGEELSGAWSRSRTRVEQFSYNAITTAAGAAATGGAATAASTAGAVAGAKHRAQQEERSETFTRVNEPVQAPDWSPPRPEPRQLDRANTVFRAGEPSPADHARRVDPIVVDGQPVQPIFDPSAKRLRWESSHEGART